jgi:3-polyprenyl-4-hydroxybenzoate decarboxylase
LSRGSAKSSHTLGRAPTVRIYERRDELTLVDDGGRVMHLSSPASVIARELLEKCRVPRERAGLLVRFRGARRAVAESVLAVLEEAGALVGWGPAVDRPAAGEELRVVLALTGGIVAAHAPALTEMLLARGVRVRIAATASALRFVSARALEALTHEPVVRSMWPSLRAAGAAPVPHLELAKWAHAVVVYPATATTLSRIARGDCSTIVSAIAVSARVPVLLAPAMNEAMVDAPAVRRNLATLREDGFLVLHPSFGYEVAAAPGARAPSYGAAPTVQTVALVTEVVLRETREAARKAAARPSELV